MWAHGAIWPHPNLNLVRFPLRHTRAHRTTHEHVQVSCLSHWLWVNMPTSCLCVHCPLSTEYLSSSCVCKLTSSVTSLLWLTHWQLHRQRHDFQLCILMLLGLRPLPCPCPRLSKLKKNCKYDWPSQFPYWRSLLPEARNLTSSDCSNLRRFLESASPWCWRFLFAFPSPLSTLLYLLCAGEGWLTWPSSPGLSDHLPSYCVWLEALEDGLSVPTREVPVPWWISALKSTASFCAAALSGSWEAHLPFSFGSSIVMVSLELHPPLSVSLNSAHTSVSTTFPQLTCCLYLNKGDPDSDIWEAK